jgi:hypothetical protein
LDFTRSIFLTFAHQIFNANMKSDRFKGYLFAIIGTLAFSNEYIFSKAAMNEVHMAQFGVETSAGAYQTAGADFDYAWFSGNINHNVFLPVHSYYSRPGSDFISGKHVPGDACAGRSFGTWRKVRAD